MRPFAAISRKKILMWRLNISCSWGRKKHRRVLRESASPSDPISADPFRAKTPARPPTARRPKGTRHEAFL
jgi:hypothetical protein